MTAIGWCEDCGDVEVQPMCVGEQTSQDDTLPIPPWSPTVLPSCCHYAYCPRCGGDVDQWAWT